MKSSPKNTAFDFPDLFQEMLDAMKKVLDKQWKESKPFLELQTKSYLENIRLIGALKLKGKISEEKARLHLHIQKESLRTTLLTIEGIGLVTAENAINAAQKVLQKTVNTALGWTLF